MKFRPWWKISVETEHSKIAVMQQRNQRTTPQRLILTTLLAALVWRIRPSLAQEYLKEPPSFLTPCRIHVQDDACITKSFETIFSNWRTGIPGLSNLGGIDPFHIKKMRFQQTTDAVDLRVLLKDVMATGLSRNKLLKSSINDKDYTIRFHLLLPSLKIENDYKLKGRVLVLNMDSQGKMKIQIDNLDYTITAKTNLKKVGDKYFFDVQSISSHINKIGGFNIHLSNLFGGNQALEDSAHELFNQSWRDIFQVMEPAIAQTLDTVAYNRYNTILNYIPAEFLVSDLP